MKPWQCMKCQHFSAFPDEGRGNRGRCNIRGKEVYGEGGAPSWCPINERPDAEPLYLKIEEEILPNTANHKPVRPVETVWGIRETATPAHYAGTVTPWDLERCMVSSGNAFVDSRRTDAIEYCYRMKGDLLQDLLKAKHCIESAIQELEKEKA